MKNPKISIVTISFNCKDMIDKTIKSVIGLTYDNVEYIVIDGGSKDGTMDVINKYKDHIDYIVSERDKGIYDAMNKGITAATGEWIIFMNAGDIFAGKSCLEEVVPLMENDADVVYGDIIMQCSGYYYYHHPAGVENTSESMPVFHQSTIVRLSYHKQHPFDTSFRSSGDYDFFYKSYFFNHCKFQYIPVVIACFDNTGGLSKDNHALSLRENLRIWGKEGDYIFKAKLEWQLFIYGVVMWIKRNLLSRKMNREVELQRLTREGKNYVLGEYRA